ncbi:MAG TPA: Maf family protein [Chloroflexota bacterium]|nr:Maf family protein [Chloroflexota bacterium]
MTISSPALLTGPLILASTSPRRRALLERWEIPFEVIPSTVTEDVEGSIGPIEATTTLALRKAEAVPRNHRADLVIGADTVVEHHGEILTKPIDVADARAMLARLRGHWHRVVTGLAVMDPITGRREVSAVITRVKLRNYSDRELARYIASGEPMDKAGSYAIQGRGGRLVELIDGCYNNVVGLPLCELAVILRRFGWAPLLLHPVCTDQNGCPCPRVVNPG